LLSEGSLLAIALTPQLAEEKKPSILVNSKH